MIVNLLLGGKSRKSLEEIYNKKRMLVCQSEELESLYDRAEDVKGEIWTSRLEPVESALHQNLEAMDTQETETDFSMNLGGSQMECTTSTQGTRSEFTSNSKGTQTEFNSNSKGTHTEFTSNTKGTQSEITCFCSCGENRLSCVLKKKGKDKVIQTPKEFTVSDEFDKFAKFPESSKLEEKRKAIDVFDESLKNNNGKCNFYTGLDFAQILILLKLLTPACLNMNYFGSQSRTSGRFRNHKFSITQELIFVLMRLRVGLLVEDLRYRFNSSVGHISKIFDTWIQCMYLEMKIHLEPRMFPSHQQIALNLPSVFKGFKNIRVKLDCTKFFCQAPKNFEHQGDLYSQYEAHTTFKVLVGITPNGTISFVSDVFEGSISDRELVIQSKLADKLQESDLVLADRGFTIQDILDCHK